MASADGYLGTGSLTHLVAGSPAEQALRASPAPGTVGRIRGRSRGRKEVRESRSRTDLGTVITEEHAFYILTYGMMVGIRVSVGKAILTRTMHDGEGERAEVLHTPDLRIDDFMVVEKYVFPPRGSSQTPPHRLQHPFKFKDYAPLVFRHLRERFGIDTSDYTMSLCGDVGYIEFISNSKSGQFFFYSHDGRFMIKTQTEAESQFLRRILPHYYRYVMANPNTLLTRFYGMHRVKMHHIKQRMHFVIMQSAFDTECEIHEKYDLKGSTHGRAATEKERARRDPVLKDLDLMQRGRPIYLGPKRAAFLRQIEKDAEFLASLGIMDYSLLLGVHDASRAHVPGHRRRSVHVDSAALESARRSVSPDARRDGAGNGAGNGEGGGEGSGGEGSGGEGSGGEGSGADGSGADSVGTASPAKGGDGGEEAEAAAVGDDVVAAADIEFSVGGTGEDAEPDAAADTAASAAAEASAAEASAAVDTAEEEKGGRSSPEPSHASSAATSAGAGSGATRVSPGPVTPPPRRRPSVADAIAVHKPVFTVDNGGYASVREDGTTGEEIYFMGIIDVLQQYNSRKHVEHFFKSIRHDSHSISCVNPRAYAKRFVEFLTEHTA